MKTTNFPARLFFPNPHPTPASTREQKPPIAAFDHPLLEQSKMSLSGHTGLKGPELALAEARLSYLQGVKTKQHAKVKNVERILSILQSHLQHSEKKSAGQGPVTEEQVIDDTYAEDSESPESLDGNGIDRVDAFVEEGNAFLEQRALDADAGDDDMNDYDVDENGEYMEESGEEDASGDEQEDAEDMEVTGENGEDVAEEETSGDESLREEDASGDELQDEEPMEVAEVDRDNAIPEGPAVIEKTETQMEKARKHITALENKLPKLKACRDELNALIDPEIKALTELISPPAGKDGLTELEQVGYLMILQEFAGFVGRVEAFVADIEEVESADESEEEGEETSDDDEEVEENTDEGVEATESDEEAEEHELKYGEVAEVKEKGEAKEGTEKSTPALQGPVVGVFSIPILGGKRAREVIDEGDVSNAKRTRLEGSGRLEL